jgi:hypothetical protein
MGFAKNAVTPNNEVTVARAMRGLRTNSPLSSHKNCFEPSPQWRYNRHNPFFLFAVVHSAIMELLDGHIKTEMAISPAQSPFFALSNLSY